MRTFPTMDATDTFSAMDAAESQSTSSRETPHHYRGMLPKLPRVRRHILPVTSLTLAP